MARWASGTAERLREAALELFTAHGFEQTTATEIAHAAGLTQRTFFRHFADKRDVLFLGQDQFAQAFVDGMQAAPTDGSPLDQIASALASAAAFFPNERRADSRLRQTVINANTALQERERHKFAQIAQRLAEALRARNIADPAATLAADAAASVFGIAFSQWIREGERRTLRRITTGVLDELRNLSSSVPGQTLYSATKPAISPKEDRLRQPT